MKSQKPRGKEAFLSHYQGIFEDRWPSLLAALSGEGKPVDYDTGLLTPFRLDQASVYAATRFSRLDSGRWLDMCAAPGGKTLVMNPLIGEDATMTANERSPDRRRRLKDVLDRHLPPSRRALVSITGVDAAAMCRKERDAYDRILLDAPCSSERHVLSSPKHLDEWTEARPKHLHASQWALLSCAFLLLKPGGELVYSTCALSPQENDGVIDRLFAKYGAAAASLETPLYPGAERTDRGVLILPDVCEGAGPMYVSFLSKVL